MRIQRAIFDAALAGISLPKEVHADVLKIQTIMNTIQAESPPLDSPTSYVVWITTFATASQLERWAKMNREADALIETVTRQLDAIPRNGKPSHTV